MRKGLGNARPQEGQQPPLMVIKAAVEQAIEVDGVGSVKNLRECERSQGVSRDKVPMGS